MGLSDTPLQRSGSPEAFLQRVSSHSCCIDRLSQQTVIHVWGMFGRYPHRAPRLWVLLSFAAICRFMFLSFNQWWHNEVQVWACYRFIMNIYKYSTEYLYEHLQVFHRISICTLFIYKHSTTICNLVIRASYICPWISADTYTMPLKINLYSPTAVIPYFQHCRRCWLASCLATL